MKRQLNSDSSQDGAPVRFILLEVPVSSGHLLPCQVNVTWTVTPYRLSAHLTPRYPWTSPSRFSASNSCLLTAPRPPPPPTIVRPPAPVPYPLFFTWSSDEVDICDKFLLGSCPLATTCKMHHTPLPFHWQLYSVESRRWVDVKPSAQLLLERMYCNVKHEKVTLKEGDAVFTLSLDDMQILDTFKYSGARRLSNSDSRLQNPHFPCEWSVYWWRSNNGWEEYPKGVSALLLEKMAIKEVECCITVRLQEYRVDFTTMTQTNLDSGLSGDIRCRPVYRPPESLFPHLKTRVPTLPVQYPYQPNFNVDPLEDFATWYPPVWCLASEQDSDVVDVPIGTRAFLTVQKFFYKSLSESKVEIVAIQQVQNFLHWDKYQRQKAYMQKKHAGSNELLERHLFHGTDQDAAGHICRNNFDPRVAGINGKRLGFGCYFATSASVAHDYTDEISYSLRHTFLAKVLVGKVTRGHSHYRRPPCCNTGRGFYDACVDSVDDPKDFAVFDSCQCYPYYLIKYKELDGVIEI
ncbi:protein mono-ADP-ribosyltransferase TIPARP-like [Hippocampus zosterae]|uniref:protein mono-ADP-ribosyltransferase TIPARP-like n=1 Tax=Hippocampus zosterae TaxID=109293 RepID=UPI00223C9E56|nr:protein mono-ADP-ribosyltransferase TIPARP-like [Hippocampus zosterae]